MKLPWAESHSRFTLLFERFVIDVLRQTNTQAAKEILGISWDEAWHLAERAVQRGMDRKPARIIPLLGVDEKSAGKGQQNYITIISDLENSTEEPYFPEQEPDLTLKLPQESGARQSDIRSFEPSR